MPRPPSTLAVLTAGLLLLAAPATAHPRGSSSRSYHSRSTTYHTYRSHPGHTRRYAYGVPRDSHGRIKRSSEEKRKFERQTGYPHGRPGYVVDHIIPLSEGGTDDPRNMQWQTEGRSKAKDKTERKR